ncbi:MAG: hypothetical protein AAF151_19200 [Cyanobacteria bacterium J06656_5]
MKMVCDRVFILTITPKADDQGTEGHGKVVPFGILNMQTDELALYLGQSAEMPDFIVDCLDHGRADNQPNYLETHTLAINLDGGGATRLDRTQFIKRMVSFSRDMGLTLE